MEKRREEEGRETGQKLEFSFDCSTVTMTTTKSASASAAATDNGDAEGANRRAGECLNVISKRVRREKVQSPRENFPREQHNISALGKRKEGGRRSQGGEEKWPLVGRKNCTERAKTLRLPRSTSVVGRNVAKTATAREMTVKLRATNEANEVMASPRKNIIICDSSR